jgi:hypothetical protein
MFFFSLFVFSHVLHGPNQTKCSIKKGFSNQTGFNMTNCILEQEGWMFWKTNSEKIERGDMITNMNNLYLAY